jgi:hypothetical protein
VLVVKQTSDPMPAGVGEPQPGAGVGAFLADDQAHAGRRGRQVQQAGDLGHPRARPHLALSSHPEPAH